jgi:cytidylate kinase
VSYESLVSEDYQAGIHQTIYDMLIGHSEQFSTYKRVFEVAKTLASIGKVIIIGRAGVFVTAQMPAGIHLRLVAEESKRVKWARERLEVTEAKAVEIVRKQDRDRERLVKDFFDKDINEAAHYDAIFNTGRLEHDVLAKIILQMIRAKAAEPGLDAL